MVRVSVATAGADIDPDGYTVLVGDSVRAIEANAQVTVGGLPAGDVIVSLVGVASNCALEGMAARQLAVSAGATVVAAFVITCSPLAWHAAADLPTARLGLATAVAGGELYAIGGYAKADDPGRTVVEAYDPATDTWTAKSPMPTGRRWTSAATVNGRVYVIGGHTGVGAPGLGTVEAYDPAADTWAARAPMPTPRLAVAAAAVNGIIYVVGGTPDNSTVVRTVEAYDPATDTWTSKADMPTVRLLIALEAVGGKLYAIGGGPDPATGLAAVEVYDPATDSWTRGADMPAPRSAACSGVVGGRIYVIGGASGGRTAGTVNAIVEAYDPATDSWTSEPSMPTARFGLSCAALDGAIYAVGGAAQTLSPHNGLDKVERFEPGGS